jgi:hypothetical protein
MEWSILVSKQVVRIATGFWFLAFFWFLISDLSWQATNLFRDFSVTFRSECEISSRWIKHLLNFKCLSEQLVLATILLLSMRGGSYETRAISCRWRKRNIDRYYKSFRSPFYVLCTLVNGPGLCISWTRRLIFIVLWRNFLALRHLQRTWKIEQDRWRPSLRSRRLVRAGEERKSLNKRLPKCQ